MSKENAWSYSKWEVYNTCPAKFKFKYVDKLPDDQSSPALVKGRAVHKEGEDYLKNPGTPLPKSYGKFGELMSFMRANQPVVEFKIGLDESWKRTGYYDKSIWLRAILDAGINYGDGHMDVVDFKTGKRYDTNEDQIELFGAASMANWNLKSVTCRLWYVDSGEEVVREYEGAEWLKTTKAKWEERVRLMYADRLWPARPSDKCRFCSFSKSAGGPCRFG